jgi:hypothetical protein
MALWGELAVPLAGELAVALPGGLAAAFAAESAAGLTGEFGASPWPGGTWLTSSPSLPCPWPQLRPRVNACYVIIPGGSHPHTAIAAMDPGEVAGQAVPVWPVASQSVESGEADGAYESAVADSRSVKTRF